MTNRNGMSLDSQMEAAFNSGSLSLYLNLNLQFRNRFLYIV